tara:strand:+ start:560 stop:754 length:195 start_codon:yes stop_codon:yes gene_type:complete
MHVRTKEDIEKENVLLKHQYKMLKIKYDMVNGALKKITLLSMRPSADFTNIKDTKVKGETYGHQ